jgi:epsilon-lactone hydrolase
MASPENVRARQLLDELVATLNTTAHEPTPEELRARLEGWMTTNFPAPPQLRTELVDADGVPCVSVMAPGTSAARTVVYLHGGNYLFGSSAGYRGFAAALSRAADATVLLVDYRLAPENPHPAALQDATTAYRWAVDAAGAPASTVVAGDSSGGGLAVALLAALRDAAEDLPAAAVCISPWVDLTLSGPSLDERASLDPLISRAGLATMAGAYLGGQDPKTPSASPLFADLTGLPPLLILVGTSEVLLDDSTRLARRARDAGVDVTLQVVEDMYHLWPLMSSFLPEARQTVDEIGRFVQSATSHDQPAT